MKQNSIGNAFPRDKFFQLDHLSVKYLLLLAQDCIIQILLLVFIFW